VAKKEEGVAKIEGGVAKMRKTVAKSAHLLMKKKMYHYRLITDARFANKFYSDWGVTYTTAAQLSSTLNRCNFHFSIDILDAYHLSLWAG
jgi:hypothetical protein